MAEPMGINGGLPTSTQQAALGARPTAAQQQAAINGVPALARVPLPPRSDSDERVRPKKAAAQMQPARNQGGGTSPVATAPVAATFSGADQLGASAGPLEERGAHQGRAGVSTLPTAAELVAFTRSSRGDLVYLERERWNNHIVPAHVTDPPMARGKRTTTWWPVLHAATGVPSMTEQQVVGVIMDAVRGGHWQNAPRGTMLSVYDLPAQQAASYGVSEVKVSAAPDGRILSAYPSAGSNVLAVRELTAQEQAAAAPAATPARRDKPPLRSHVPGTTFG